MNNKEKYDSAFMTVFDVGVDQLTEDLKYQSITAWDSVGHMALMAELESLFEIMLDMDDVVDFGSYTTGVKTLEKYGIIF